MYERYQQELKNASDHLQELNAKRSFLQVSEICSKNIECATCLFACLQKK
jgi:hypothetical protein